jgi:MoaA/NifB/PqqE/SkfB family radical SAM enzyme
MPIQPEFYRKWGTIKLALKSYPLARKIDLPDIISVLRLRKKLLLNRIVKFDNQYYSTLTIPAFPSSAYNNMVSKGGLNFESMGTTKKRNIDTAFLAVSSICPNNCGHCYEKHNLNNNNIEIPVKKWIEIMKTLQQNGTSIIILTGGEPLSRFDELLEILQTGDKNLSDFHLHTSGNLLTKEKALLLKEAGLKAAAVGFDDNNPIRFEKIRQKGMYDNAVNALKIFNEVGIMTYVNLCASKEFIHTGSLYEYYEFVKNLNVSFIQLLEPRPCGGYLFDNESVILNEEERKILLGFAKEINKNKRYKNGPIVYYVAHVEGKEQMGCCMGGLSHFYVDSAGNINPCVFLPVSFGNIMNEEFTTIFNRMRKAVPHPLHKECASLILADTIRKRSPEGAPVSFNDIKTEWKELL